MTKLSQGGGSSRSRRILRSISLGLVLAGTATFLLLACRGYDVRVDGETVRCPAPITGEFGHYGCTEDSWRMGIGVYSLAGALLVAAVLLVIARPAGLGLGRLFGWLGLGLVVASGVAVFVVFGCLPFSTGYGVDGEIECPAPITFRTDATYMEGDVTNGMDDAEGAARCSDERRPRLLYAGAGLVVALGAGAAAVAVRRRTTPARHATDRARIR